MSQAADGNTVKIHYTGTLEDGSQFDSSEGREPLEFTIGGGQVIVGFDNACRGMVVGDKKTVTLPPEEAYGEHNPEMVAQVERAMMSMITINSTSISTISDKPQKLKWLESS